MTTALAVSALLALLILGGYALLAPSEEGEE
jgi:hypothetical protein